MVEVHTKVLMVIQVFEIWWRIDWFIVNRRYWFCYFHFLHPKRPRQIFEYSYLGPRRCKNQALYQQFYFYPSTLRLIPPPQKKKPQVFSVLILVLCIETKQAIICIFFVKVYTGSVMRSVQSVFLSAYVFVSEISWNFPKFYFGNWHCNNFDEVQPISIHYNPLWIWSDGNFSILPENAYQKRLNMGSLYKNISRH